MYLKSNLTTRPVVVRIIPSLHVTKVGLILGNNLASAKVVVNLQVSSISFKVVSHIYVYVCWASPFRLHSWFSNVAWLGLTHSIIITTILFAMVAMVFLCPLHWHFLCRNRTKSVEDIPERYVWKPDHGDEFWPPTHMMLSYQQVLECSYVSWF